MSSTILIAPFEGPLAEAAASEALAAGWSVAVARAGKAAPNRGAAASGRTGSAKAPAAGTRPPEAGPASLIYNPASYVSVSSLVQAAVNALGDLDVLLLAADPSSDRADFSAGKPGDLAQYLEERCAGPLWLAREVSRRFEARKTGAILLLAPEIPKDARLGPAAAIANGAFTGLGEGLFSASAGGAWSAFGLRDASGQADRCARFALGLLAEKRSPKAGRWLRYTGKSGIFGAF